MELKYCECCGGLLLRARRQRATYCGECAVMISDLAPRRQRKRAELGTAKGRAGAAAGGSESGGG